MIFIFISMTNMDCYEISCEWKDFVSTLSESHSNHSTGLCTFMCRLNMILKMTPVGSLIITLITRISDSFMFWFIMDHRRPFFWVNLFIFWALDWYLPVFPSCILHLLHFKQFSLLFSCPIPMNSELVLTKATFSFESFITILAAITQTCNMHHGVAVRILFGLKCPSTIHFGSSTDFLLLESFGFLVLTDLMLHWISW